MIVINLRIYYPVLYRQDVFCEVPEQVKLLAVIGRIEAV